MLLSGPRRPMKRFDWGRTSPVNVNCGVILVFAGVFFIAGFIVGKLLN